MTYRIIKATEKSGQERYCIQKRVLWLFWVRISEWNDTAQTYVYCDYKALELAEKELKQLVEKNNLRKKRKIVKREVVK